MSNEKKLFFEILNICNWVKLNSLLSI
jgi:hypothetical protein